MTAMQTATRRSTSAFVTLANADRDHFVAIGDEGDGRDLTGAAAPAAVRRGTDQVFFIRSYERKPSPRRPGQMMWDRGQFTHPLEDAVGDQPLDPEEELLARDADGPFDDIEGWEMEQGRPLKLPDEEVSTPTTRLVWVGMEPDPSPSPSTLVRRGKRAVLVDGDPRNLRTVDAHVARPSSAARPKRVSRIEVWGAPTTERTVVVQNGKTPAGKPVFRSEHVAVAVPIAERIRELRTERTVINAALDAAIARLDGPRPFAADDALRLTRSA
jgi:hypothetical protein